MAEPAIRVWYQSFIHPTEHAPYIDRLQTYLNIDNIMNKKPPIVAISISGSAYDLVGRSFKLGMRFKF